MKPTYLALALLLAGCAGWTQDYPATEGGQTADGPPGPGRGVARISLLNGDVSVRRGDSGDVTAAAINAPLMSGDALLTSSAGRAELQFDASNLARVAANSEVHMGDLEYRRNQVQVALGLLTYTVLRDTQSQNEIDTPLVAVRPKGRGAYRILVREDGSSEITVRAGDADIATAEGSQVLHAGQTMMVRGTKEDPEFQITQAIQEDEWDRWNVERDHQLLRATSTRYVNPDVNGAEDLDPYGRWVNDGSYGMVWTPTVGPDWAPYREGRWIWGDDYGWTWVSYDPWGWAPYHYGRWYHASFGWAWWPGPFRGPCYWSPALVGFFGFGGGGFGVGFGFGNVGWVPLAPFEPFHPWWGHGFYGGGYRNTVIVNNINVYNSYRNARFGNGVTAVNAADFGRHNSRFMAMNGSQIRSAGLVRGALPVAPDRASLRYSDRAVNMSNFRQSRNTQFFGRAPQSRMVPFEQQRQAVQQNARGFGGRGGSFGAAESPAGRMGGNAGSSSPSGFPRSGAPAVSGGQSGGAHGWGRFGQPIHEGDSPANSSVARGPQQGGWNRFGGSGGGPQSSAPSQGFGRYSSPYNGRGNEVRVNPPIVRDRPSAPARGYEPGAGAGNYQPGAGARGYQPGGGSYGRWQSSGAPSYSAPRAEPPSFGGRSPNYSAPRMEAPRYSAPPRMESPRYSAPPRMESPRYSAPRSAPSFSGGGGAGYRGGGGGGGRSSGGGGGERSGGGGGGGGRHR